MSRYLEFYCEIYLFSIIETVRMCRKLLTNFVFRCNYNNSSIFVARMLFDNLIGKCHYIKYNQDFAPSHCNFLRCIHNFLCDLIVNSLKDCKAENCFIFDQKSNRTLPNNQYFRQRQK